MTAPTHRQYAVSFACITTMLVHDKSMTEINYYLALVIILVASKAGALFPDVDHSWQNVHDKTVVNKIINVLIHITGGKHRSWQTHSIDICAYFTIFAYFLPKYLFGRSLISEVNREVLTLLLLGFASGWISHLIADMMTSAGVRILAISKFKAKIVPKKLGRITFNTGHEWESFCYRMVRVLNIFLGMMVLIYPFSSKLFDLIEQMFTK